jgi:hypothetical protein
MTNQAAEPVTDTDLQNLVQTYEATAASARSIHHTQVLACLRELQRLRDTNGTETVSNELLKLAEDAPMSAGTRSQLTALALRVAGIERELIDALHIGRDALAQLRESCEDARSDGRGCPLSDVGYDANGSPVVDVKACPEENGCMYPDKCPAGCRRDWKAVTRPAE